METFPKVGKSGENTLETYKMELLQSQAPADQELSGSSASARHGTFDIRHQTLDMGNRNLEILKRSYFQREQNKAQAFPQNWNI